MAAKKVLSDLRRNAAAIVLQKNVRRYYARQAYKRSIEAALVMQKYARACFLFPYLGFNETKSVSFKDSGVERRREIMLSR